MHLGTDEAIYSTQVPPIYYAKRALTKRNEISQFDRTTAGDETKNPTTTKNKNRIPPKPKSHWIEFQVCEYEWINNDKRYYTVLGCIH